MLASLCQVHDYSKNIAEGSMFSYNYMCMIVNIIYYFQKSNMFQVQSAYECITLSKVSKLL